MASKSFEEALAAAERFAEGEDAGKRGPWDELASWYWGLWDELGSGISQEGQNGGEPQPNMMHNAKQTPKDSMSQGMAYDSGQEHQILNIWPGTSEAEDLGQDNSFDLPPKSFRDELIILYFKHVHPLCPVFDEVEFHNTYYHRGDLACLQSITLVEFQAMMFAGAMVFHSIIMACKIYQRILTAILAPQL